MRWSSAVCNDVIVTIPINGELFLGSDEILDQM